MIDFARVSISLPAETLDKVDSECRESGETRSQFFLRAVEECLRRGRRRDAIDRYIDSYVTEPESASDQEISAAIAAETLGQDRWE